MNANLFRVLIIQDERNLPPPPRLGWILCIISGVSFSFNRALVYIHMLHGTMFPVCVCVGRKGGVDVWTTMCLLTCCFFASLATQICRRRDMRSCELLYNYCYVFSIYISSIISSINIFILFLMLANIFKVYYKKIIYKKSSPRLLLFMFGYF